MKNFRQIKKDYMVNFNVYLNTEEEHSDSKYTNMQFPVNSYQYTHWNI